jgi:hypothetical protein
VDNLEEFIALDKRIDAAEDRAADSQRESIRDRWEFGRLMLAKRKGKQLPKGYLDTLTEATGKSRSELQFRMQFAERYPTEDEVSTAVDTLTSWNAVRASLPKPSQPGKSKPPTPPARNRKAEEITALREQGLTTKEIAEKTGESERTVRREREYDALVEAAVEDAVTIPWDSIPGNQQAKLERAKTTIRKQLERELRTQMLAALDQYRAKLDEDFSKYKAQYDAQNERFKVLRDEERKRYNRYIEVARAKGLITPSEYTTILACLHPDNSASTEKRAEAFRLFRDEKVKALLVKEES